MREVCLLSEMEGSWMGLCGSMRSMVMIMGGSEDGELVKSCIKSSKILLPTIC